MNPSLILIHGLKYSGKSTIADRLMNDYSYVRVKLADPLKNMLRSLLRDAGIDAVTIERCLEGDLKEVPLEVLCGRTPRHAMMTLGNEWRDLLDNKLWSYIAKGKIKDLLAKGKRVVVDDIRYPFELDILGELGATRWAVTRGNLHFEPFGEDRHPSERPMPVANFNAHLKNDYTTIRELHAHVDGMLPVGPSLLSRVKRTMRLAA
jgi:hypothetical protein